MKIGARANKQIADARWGYVQTVLTGLGLLTLTWAGIEIIVDSFFEWYHSISGIKKRRKIPQQTQAKVSYLREIAEDPRWSATEVETILYFADELDRLAVERRHFVHGHLFQEDPNSVEWRIYRVKVAGDRLEHSFHDYGHEDINELLRQVGALRDLASPFFGKILGLPEFR